jgi:hypothetical protein
MEIAIAGEGELVIRYIDKDGRTLMQERLVVSGSPTMRRGTWRPTRCKTTDGAPRWPRCSCAGAMRASG